MSGPEPAGPPSNRSALLLIRAWLEDPTKPALRARITVVVDLDGAKEVVHLASTREELHTALDNWLDHLIRPKT